MKHITLARIAQSDSERAGVAALKHDFGIKIPLTSVYRMMDNLDDKAIDLIQGVVLSAAQQMLGESLDVLFYDCTREFNSEVRHFPTQPEPVLERPLQAA